MTHVSQLFSQQQNNITWLVQMSIICSTCQLSPTNTCTTRQRSGTTAGAERPRRSHTSSDSRWAGYIRLQPVSERLCSGYKDHVWLLSFPPPPLNWTECGEFLLMGIGEKRKRGKRRREEEEDTEVFVHVRFYFHRDRLLSEQQLTLESCFYINFSL